MNWDEVDYRMAKDRSLRQQPVREVHQIIDRVLKDAFMHLLIRSSTANFRDRRMLSNIL